MAGCDTDDGVPADRPGRAPRTVLYIEDSPANVTLVERILRSHRPSVSLLVAATGARGLALASEARPSLVLLDLVLPDISGEVVLRTIRRDHRTSGLRVVILSGAAEPGQQDRLRHAGADDVLAKPFVVQDLLAVVDGTAITQIEPASPLQMASGPLDPARLQDLRRVHPDPESWRSFLDAFVVDCRVRSAALARAAHDGDADAVAHGAHTLAGSCSIVGDGDVLALLLGIQSGARRGQLPDDRQLAALDAALQVTEHALGPSYHE